MAGRKPPSEPNFFNTLLGKLGLGGAEPAKAAKKGAKRRRKRPDAEPATGLYGADLGVGSGDDGASPFAEYGASGGLMGEPGQAGDDGFGDALSYEAAAAAGYAPEPVTRPAPVIQPLRPVPPTSAPPADGRLFSQDALDTSLDALFSGLESGLANPPLPPMPEPVSLDKPPARPAGEKPLFDEFGLTPPTPLAPSELPQPDPPSTTFDAPDPFEAPPEPAAPTPPPAPIPPRAIHKPIVSEAPAAPTPTLRPEPPAPMPTAPAPAALGGSLDAKLPPPVVLPLAEGVDLNALFTSLERLPGIAGAFLVGYDGLLIMASPGSDLDGDFLGALACNLFMSNSGQLAKMKRPELRRIVLETASGALLMTAADMGILVVVSQEGRAMDIAGIMGTIGGALGR